MSRLLDKIRKAKQARFEKEATTTRRPVLNLNANQLQILTKLVDHDTEKVYSQLCLTDEYFLTIDQTEKDQISLEFLAYLCDALGDWKNRTLAAYRHHAYATIEYFSGIFPSLQSVAPNSHEILLNFLKTGHTNLILNNKERINSKLNFNWTVENIQTMFTKNQDESELNDYIQVLLSVSVSFESGARKHFLHFVFTLTMALVYQTNCKTININNRWRALIATFPEIAERIDPPTTEDIVTTWLLIEKALGKGLSLELVIEKVMEVTTPIDCPVFTAVFNFIGYSRMTPVRLVCEALSQFTEFPWKLMFNNFPILKAEKDKLMSYLDIVEHDPYAGLKFQGISQVIPNLTYLSYQLHVQMGGRMSLTNYKGIGSPDNRTTIALKKILDESVTRARRDRFTLEYS